MKKKYAVYAGIIAYIVLACILYENSSTASDTGEAKQEEIEKQTPAPDISEHSERVFAEVESSVEYNLLYDQEMYVPARSSVVTEKDKENLLESCNLPSLERMNEQDAEMYMRDLQALRRVETLNADVSVFYTPQYNWKAVYCNSINNVRQALNFSEIAEFEGSRASDLNEFIADNAGKQIKICSESIDLDETIVIPSNVILDGNGVAFSGTGQLEYAILIENAESVGIYNVQLRGGFKHGVYIIECKHVLLWNNEVTLAANRAICVMGTNSYINLVKNNVYENGDGGIFFDGHISHCIIQGNSIYQNRGTRNLSAGIAFASVTVEDKYTPYNAGKDEHLYNLTEVPNNNVIIDNVIKENCSSGFYSEGGYMNYVLNNTIECNEKEGMCLDFGTFGTFVYNNKITKNGNRNRQSDEDLKADFVLEAGRLEDSSSTAKLPGISIDNAAYNIIYQNIIQCNAGSGVKMVRSGYRNLIIGNVIDGNNVGVNDLFHGFGVELGYASTPDQPVIGLDFTPDYENIVARNIITGSHYAGIYLERDTYCNDLIDNVIMDCTDFSIENHSTFYNSAVGIVTNMATLDFTWQ